MSDSNPISEEELTKKSKEKPRSNFQRKTKSKLRKTPNP
jgi:hypothetical protein